MPRSKRYGVVLFSDEEDDNSEDELYFEPNDDDCPATYHEPSTAYRVQDREVSYSLGLIEVLSVGSQ